MNTIMRRFELVRDEDISGVSGTGVVAVGVQLPSGRCIIEWTVKYTSIALYNDIGTLDAIHGHGGATRVRWLDNEKGNPIRPKKPKAVMPSEAGTSIGPSS